MKYFRVIKDNPLWEVGAILADNASGTTGKGYIPIEDVWLKNEKCPGEYLSAPIVENQPEFFERVYRNDAEKIFYLTKTELKKFYEKFKK